MWVFDVVLLIKVYLWSWVWQLLAWPWVKKFGRGLEDGGWALARVLSSLIVASVIFTVSMCGVKANTDLGLSITIALMLFVSIFFWYQRDRLHKNNLKLIVIEETLLLSGIIFAGTMRGFWPALDSLEKYMDFGFIYQYLLSSSLPVTDMWFAGKQINYYSFGHFWQSILIRLWGEKPTIGFNLALAYAFGINLSLCFSVGVNLLKKESTQKKIAAGLFAAGLTMFGGNTHIVWWVIKNHGLWEGATPYWYALATRFIDHTIHEFPSYTFTIGDLHAHLMDIPIVLTFIAIFIEWSGVIKEKVSNIYMEVVMGFLLGVMMMTNTWDCLIYILLLVIFCIGKILERKTHWAIYIRGALIIGGMAIITAVPWWWSFQQIATGVVFVTEKTPLWQLANVWLIQILFGILAMWLFRKNIAVKSLIILAFMLIIFPEIFYFKDIYDNFPRANTMFKLTYQAFIILSLFGGAITWKLFNKNGWVLALLSLAVQVILMVYPFTSYPNFYVNFKKYYGLDGEVWIENYIGDKYGAIQYLKQHRNGKTLAEYPGESFTLSNPTAVFSGVPEILGWRSHEELWRNNLIEIGSRIEEVRILFEDPTSTRAKRIIDKYNLGWILVGREERAHYQVHYFGLTQIGEKVWEEGDNFLIKIR